MSEEFEDVDWAEIYERQAARSPLADRICELLDLSAGSEVFDLGCGPGHTAVELAGRVGRVYALDRRPGALSYLTGEVAGDEPVVPVVGDVESLPVCPGEPTPALLAFVLHHLEEPERAIESVAASLARGSALLVIEYHPEEAGEVGPPLGARLSPARVGEWLAEVGFDLEETLDLSEEKYALLARR